MSQFIRSASPVRVGLVVLALHAIWITLFFAAGHQARDFIKIGPNFVTRSHASSIIRYDPHYAYPQNHDVTQQGQGFDGQFVYYIALDPSKARYYLDDPSYRYERILYPIAARFTALEQPSLVPWTMLIINWLAVGVGVIALGAWLKRKGVSPWFALIYGVYPGMLITLQRDLTEPLAYGLVALAVYLFDFGGRRGLLWSGITFGLAALARETTLVFALTFGLSILAGRPNALGRLEEHRTRLVQAIPFALLTLAPVGIWTFATWSWLGVPRASANDLTAPFVGAFQVSFTATRQPVDLLFVVTPALLAAGVAMVDLRRGVGRTERLCLLVNVVFITVLASGKVWVSYSSIGRVSIAIVLAALLCLPYLGSIRLHGPSSRCSGTSLVALMTATLWLAMIPVVMYYGFSSVKI